MSGEKNVEAPEVKAPAPISDTPVKHSEKDMGKDGIPSDSISSASAVSNAMSGIKIADQTSALEQGLYYPLTNGYDYYYPAYNGAFAQQSDDKGYFNAAGGSYTGIQSDNSSMLYYLPSYGPYTTGYMGIDGKPNYASSDYLQQPCPYGSEALFPYYSYSSSYSGNGSTAAVKSGVGSSGSGKSNGYNNISKTNTNLSSKTLPFNSKFQQSSNFPKSVYQNQHLKPLNKFGSGYHATTGLAKGFTPASKFSSFANQRSAYMQYSPVNYQSNSRVWNNNNNNYRYKSRETFGRNAENEALTELTRGPRSDSRNTSPKVAAEDEKLPGIANAETDKYNLQEFQTEYDDAKFYVIKSYSEDDVHKCIKYDVWSSTPNGNRKLDAAFGEAGAKTSETGKKCPVFLFFSVNGSGQFVGVAEMIGQVDFSKNMDFWQLDKWNGFFPIKWHLIKDVPNTLLRHIILENNDSRPVTYSRDTQEIGLKQGLEMLRIFKNYSERTSVLDDFNFYEDREKSLKAKRKSKPASETRNSEGGEGIISVEQPGKTSQSSADPSSLVSLTKNLSLNSQSLQSSI